MTERRSSLVTTDRATGMRMNPPRWPHGTVPDPFGCRWCGCRLRWHGWSYLPGRPNHQWEFPTNAQVLRRMQVRRKLRGNQ